MIIIRLSVKIPFAIRHPFLTCQRAFESISHTSFPRAEAALNKAVVAINAADTILEAKAIDSRGKLRLEISINTPIPHEPGNDNKAALLMLAGHIREIIKNNNHGIELALSKNNEGIRCIVTNSISATTSHWENDSLNRQFGAIARNITANAKKITSLVAGITQEFIPEPYPAPLPLAFPIASHFLQATAVAGAPALHERTLPSPRGLHT